MNTAPVSTIDQESAPLAPAIGDYLTVVTRRSGTIVLPLVACTLLAAAGAFMLPQEYRESTVVQVEDPDVVGAFYTNIGLPVPHKQILSTIQQKIGSISFLKPIVDKFDVDEGYDRFDPKEAAALMEDVRDRLSVNTTLQKSGPDLFSITYRGRDPAKVARFVKGVRDEYEAVFLDQYQNAVRDAHAHVKAIYDTAKKEYDDATAALKTFQDTHGHVFVGDSSDVGAQMADRLGKLESDIVAFGAQLKGQEETLKDVTRMLAETSPVRPGSQTESISDRYRQQELKVEVLRLAFEDAKKKRTEISPVYLKAKSELDEAMAQLAQIPKYDRVTRDSEPNPEYDRLVAQQKTAKSEIARLTAVLESTTKSRDDLRAEMENLPEKKKRADELRTRRDAAKYQWERAHRQFQTADATKDRVIGKEARFFTVLDSPTPESARNKQPVSPNIPLIIGIGAFVGIVLGAGAAFLREFATPGFTTPNQVRYGLPVPMLGEVATLRTGAEDAAIKRKRVFGGVAAIFVAATLAFVHVAYFSKSYRDSLPRPVFDAMRRIYGKG